jgi:hypothetical protein
MHERYAPLSLPQCPAHTNGTANRGRSLLLLRALCLCTPRMSTAFARHRGSVPDPAFLFCVQAYTWEWFPLGQVVVVIVLSMTPK